MTDSLSRNNKTLANSRAFPILLKAFLYLPLTHWLIGVMFMITDVSGW